MITVTIKRDVRPGRQILKIAKADLSGGYTPTPGQYIEQEGPRASGILVSSTSDATYYYLRVEYGSDAVLYKPFLVDAETYVETGGYADTVEVTYDYTGTISTTTVLEASIGSATTYLREFMGADKVHVETVVSDSVKFRIGDYVEHNSRRYQLTRLPEADKSNRFRYKMDFVSEGYLLYDKLIMHLGRPDFSYTADAEGFLNLILDNIQQIDADWVLGDLPADDSIKTITFDKQSCRTALTAICEEFGLEYSIDEKTINVSESIGSNMSEIFVYGKGNALHGITRLPVDESFNTVWYGFGSQKNLPATYRDNLGRLSFDQNPVYKNVNLFGYKEGTVVFDDVYPRYLGTITFTAVYTSWLALINFDVNDYVLYDGSVKIIFLTGDLAGNEFELSSFEHTGGGATGIFIINVKTEDNGYEIPNAIIKPQVGDLFTITGIELPSSYVTAAEDELKTLTEAHATDNSLPKVKYSISLNSSWIKENTLEYGIAPGDSIRIIDSDLSLDQFIRIQTVEYPLAEPSEIKLTLSDVRVTKRSLS